MNTPQSLHHAAATAAEASALLQDPAALRMANKPQLRRFEVSALLTNGTVAQTRHIAPALPLFENAFCAFTRGSLVQTEHGPVAIEDLWPGDRIVTQDGGCQPLVWKGSTSLVPARADSKGQRHPLTSFMADSFGMQKPMSCVVAGPAARLLCTPPHMRNGTEEQKLLTPVQAFQDGMNIFETSPPTVVEMYHLCLPRHAVIQVGGLEFETYHPGPDALKMVSYAIKTLFLNLFSHADSVSDFGPLAFKRAEI
ncbi:Hint domain-containing protein [Phaeobacter sp. QD34_3]|uniref:Hint domain-containing protein n=1 Tax=unclassified Phaeobacter TaxID=2621772 RepID=UPI00237F3CB4|nr:MULTISPECIES: Hint domain-containing protein [unclassified Phaeobacter]MDE4133968.1 Hint domain-containing protein [Phaeobacter sp. QD34_3]MDE4137575.1 Hint domain-containing protein [Phaeobacter sp. QD34_24]MDE4175587.1 Hint domain-containing protein [Phaeobacter sp. PT47_59]